eukprot:3813144-Rhodomonas_salina.1
MQHGAWMRSEPAGATTGIVAAERRGATSLSAALKSYGDVEIVCSRLWIAPSMVAVSAWRTCIMM